MLTVIFANGLFHQTPDLEPIWQTADLVIAADGGSSHCRTLGIIPDMLVGDLDSIDPPLLDSYRQGKVVIHRHPARKDATDLELALDQAREKGSETIWILGALGGRWDMSLANIMLAANSKYEELQVFLAGENCSMQILHPGGTGAIHGRPGQKISLVPLKGDVQEVTLTGLEYPLEDRTLAFGTSLAVSNVMTANLATVKHREGILLCVRFRE